MLAGCWPGVDFLQLFLQLCNGPVLLLQAITRLLAGRFLPGDVLLQLPDLGLMLRRPPVNFGGGGSHMMPPVRLRFGLIHACRQDGHGYKQAQYNREKPAPTHYR